MMAGDAMFNVRDVDSPGCILKGEIRLWEISFISDQPGLGWRRFCVANFWTKEQLQGGLMSPYWEINEKAQRER
jgi:hypothetical protein